MTEFFQSCCSGVLKALHAAAETQAGQAQQHQRRKQCQQLQAAVSEFVHSTSYQASVPALLELARALYTIAEYRLALAACCQTSLDLLACESSSQAASANLHVLTAQTHIYAAKNEAALLATEDPELVLGDSMLRLTGVLGKLQAAMESMLHNEQNHWLVYEGATAMQQISTAFRSMPGKGMIQFLAFAVLATDTDLTFSLPEHLPLRIDLHLTLAHCQQTTGLHVEGLATIQRGLAAVASIEELEHLEPLPPPAEAQAAYMQAKVRLNTAHFAFTALELPTEQAVKDALQAMFTSDSDRLAALAVSLLPAAPSRVVKHQPCPAAVAKLLALAEAMAKPHLAMFSVQESEPDQVPETLPGVQAARTSMSQATHQVHTPDMQAKVQLHTPSPSLHTLPSLSHSMLQSMFCVTVSPQRLPRMPKCNLLIT